MKENEQLVLVKLEVATLTEEEIKAIAAMFDEDDDEEII